MNSAEAEFRWTSASRSHPGRVREVNEDACLEQPERGLWAVADGMGGHALGEFASRLAIRSLMDLPAPESLERYVIAAQERLQQANRRLRAEAARRDVPVIGTTIAALLASQRHCACLWAGDSRIYLYRAGRLRQLTRDHSQLEAVLSRHAARSDVTLDRPPANLITRALGGADTLEVDANTIEVDATIEDPKVLTGPWKVPTQTMKLAPFDQIMEIACTGVETAPLMEAASKQNYGKK